MTGPRTAARAVIVEDGTVLVSCYRDSVGPWYVLPGGGQRHGESLHECLVREVREEANAEVRIGKLRWVREFISGNHPDSNLDDSFHQVEVIFECELGDGSEVSLGTSPDLGQTGLHWCPVSELKSIRFYPRELARILSGESVDRMYLGDSD